MPASPHKSFNTYLQAVLFISLPYTGFTVYSYGLQQMHIRRYF